MGRSLGQHRSRRRGAGLEFSGHRAYAAGDDLRRLDWALFARVDRPFVKLFDEESELTVHLLVDASASMAFGTPSKHELACRLALCLATVVLAGQDRLRWDSLGGVAPKGFSSRRGTAPLAAVAEHFAASAAEGDALAPALARAAATGRPGLTLVVSDFLDPAFPAALMPLAKRGDELVLLQLLLPEEREPPWTGELLLEDAESGERMPVSAGPAEHEAYAERLAAHNAALRAFALRCGGDLFTLDAEKPLDELLFGELVDGRLLRGR